MPLVALLLKQLLPKIRIEVVNISPAPTESTHSTPGPALSLRLFLRDRPYSTSLLARRDASGQFPFGFALINTTPGAPASNIRITVDIYWRGTDLRGTPKFKTHEYPRGWTSARGQITNAQPATFVFHGPAITSFPAHAEEWPNFTGEIDVAAVGRLSCHMSSPPHLPPLNQEVI